MVLTQNLEAGRNLENIDIYKKNCSRKTKKAKKILAFDAVYFSSFD